MPTAAGEVWEVRRLEDIAAVHLDGVGDPDVRCGPDRLQLLPKSLRSSRLEESGGGATRAAIDEGEHRS
jgi:hypothetical protein